MDKEKIIFLDFDGVVNTAMWGTYGGKFKYGFSKPSDGKVNNFQAICWLNELHKLIKYKIVVSSSWRYLLKEVSYSQCLYNSGLDKEIQIIDCIPVLSTRNKNDEINQWLSENKYKIDDYVILDDIPNLDDHDSKLIRCNYKHGFGSDEFKKVVSILGTNN